MSLANFGPILAAALAGLAIYYLFHLLQASDIDTAVKLADKSGKTTP